MKTRAADHQDILTCLAFHNPTLILFGRISIEVQRGNAASFAGCFEELEPLEH